MQDTPSILQTDASLECTHFAVPIVRHCRFKHRSHPRGDRTATQPRHRRYPRSSPPPRRRPSGHRQSHTTARRRTRSPCDGGGNGWRDSGRATRRGAREEVRPARWRRFAAGRGRHGGGGTRQAEAGTVAVG